MGKYYQLQQKRFFRLLPLVLCAALVLFVCLIVVHHSLTQMDTNGDKNTKFPIAMVGTADDRFLQMGVSALTRLDSSRFAIEILQMEEPQAISALEQGDIAAYVVIPEGFVDAALYGEILPLKYVSTTGATGIVSIVKDEITRVIGDILLSAQKGIYGTWDAMAAHGLEENLQGVVDGISIAFTEFVFARAKAYKLTELGISDHLGLQGYLFCGIAVLFFMLITLPYGPSIVKQDYSLQQILSSKGYGTLGQLLCEFSAYFISYVLLLSGVIVVALLAGGGVGLENGMMQNMTVLQIPWRLLPVVFMVCSLSFFLFELAGNLVSGILMVFFTTLALCFVGGCMYPAYFFPDGIQKLGAILPTGLARAQIASCITGTGHCGVWLTAYGTGFFALTWAARRVRSSFAER